MNHHDHCLWMSTPNESIATRVASASESCTSGKWVGNETLQAHATHLCATGDHLKNVGF